MTSAWISSARCAATVSVEKYGIPAPAPKITPRNVGLGNLTHRDRGLHARLDALLVHEILQRQTVHHRAQHAHVVSTRTVHAALLELSSAEEVSATDHDGHLSAPEDNFGSLPRYGVHDIEIETDPTAAEDLTGELEQDSFVRRHGVSLECR